jgi:hypothetical protein
LVKKRKKWITYPIYKPKHAIISLYQGRKIVCLLNFNESLSSGHVHLQNKKILPVVKGYGPLINLMHIGVCFHILNMINFAMDENC